MGELADAGAVGFTDDGRPVVAAGVMRRALQYSAITGRAIAVHCEEPTLTRGGHAHAGAVAAELGLGALAVARREPDGRPRRRPRRRDRPADAPDAPVGARVGRAPARARRRRARAATGEVTPHHLCLTDEAVRTLDPNVKMNPPLRTEADRAALLDALRDGTISAIATDHAPHSPEEKDVPFEAAPFGVIGLETAFSALYTYLVVPGVLHARDAARAPVGRAGRRSSGSTAPRIAVGAPANLTLIDLDGDLARQARDSSARARSTPGCSASGSPAASRLTIADGPDGVRAMSGVC